MHRYIALAVLLIGCKKDEPCERWSPSRCDGNAVVACHERVKVFHEQDYWATTDCGFGTCVEVGKAAACAVSATPCDPKTAPPHIRDNGSKDRGIEVETCTLEIGDKMYYRPHDLADRTKCDPSTFKVTCADATSITTCVSFPAPNLPGLHVESFEVCKAATPDCRDGACVAR